MKKKKIFICFKLLFLCVLLGFCFYSYICKLIYSSIDVEVIKETNIKYGSGKFDTSSLLSSVSGNVVSVINDVDITKIGEQEVVFEVKKFNITKEISVIINVVDDIVPEIYLNELNVYLGIGMQYDYTSNIYTIVDKIDGELPYVDCANVTDESVNYYTVCGNLNINAIGTYDMEVIAVDKSGNKSRSPYKISVVSTGKGNSIKNVALSYLGSPYVYGGAGPNGFDCSGFVQYVYGLNGLRVGRSPIDHLYNGYAVSLDNIAVGDIIVWGYGYDKVTHSAIYIGNGQMIHAANPMQGVVIDNIYTWGNWTGVYILSIRRV